MFIRRRIDGHRWHELSWRRINFWRGEMRRYLKHFLAVALMVAAPLAKAEPPPPTVNEFNIFFGSQRYNLIDRTTFLPWDITGITVMFSVPVPITSGDVNSLSGVSAAGFSGLGTSTLSWTFPALSDGPHSFVLAGTGAHALKDSYEIPLYGGANFTKTFSVLFGDFNGDGQVDSVDVDGVDAARSQPYSIFADIDGNGVVDIKDVDLIRATVSRTAARSKRAVR
jgi:hypothetical protein